MIKFFYQPTCVKCPPAKRVVDALKKRGVCIEEHDVSTAMGLAEATLCGVLSTPTIVLTLSGREPEIYTSNFELILDKELL